MLGRTAGSQEVHKVSGQGTQEMSSQRRKKERLKKKARETECVSWEGARQGVLKTDDRRAQGGVTF